jgi:hypothetical protein
VDHVVEVMGHSWDQWEAPVVTRYDPGAIFARHDDAICYLNSLEDGQGGETYFDQLQRRTFPPHGRNCQGLHSSSDQWRINRTQ